MTMTPADLDGVSVGGQEPDPGAKAKRRSFTTEYKLAIVAEYDAGDADSRGALLRRERLHTSHISEWRRKRDAGTLGGSNGGPRKAGVGQAEFERLRRKNERLQQELDKAQLALEIVGKAHALLETISESADLRTRRSR